MRSFLMTACLFTALLTATAAPAHANQPAAQKAYMTFLQSKGYIPALDSDGDVTFKTSMGGRSLSLFIEASGTDAQFFRVVLPNIWPIESEAERQKVLAACNAANAKLKVAKVYMSGDNVWVAVELFLATPDQYQAVFDRSLSVLSQAVDTFVAAMK